MPDLHPGAQLERLLASDASMGSLARALVQDAHLAEDITQEAYHAYLRTPPPENRGPNGPNPSDQSPGGWLRAVVRNLARRSHRERARRHRREVMAAASEALPSTVELVEKVELQRHVAQAVLGLPTTLRDTVLLRYYEGLSAAEISRRSGTPASTVRVRLKRAVELLRERLDDAHEGDRRAWLPGLAALGDWNMGGWTIGVGPATSMALGGTAVKVAIQIALVVGVALLALWFAAPLFDQDREVAGPPSTVPEERTEPSESTARRTASKGAGAGRSPRATSTPDVAPEPSSPESAVVLDGESEATLRARFVDRFGDPVPGVSWQLRRELGLEPPMASPESDASGELIHRFQHASPARKIRYILRAIGPGTREHVQTLPIAAGETRDLGEITVQPGSSISGTIYGATGDRLSDARVYAYQPDPTVKWKQDPDVLGPWISYDRRRFPGFSAGDGTYEVEGLPAGEWFVAVVHARSQWEVSDAVSLAEGQHVGGVDLVLEDLRPEQWIEGVVLMPDGRPAAYAGVEVRAPGRGSYWPPSISTDGLGVFILRVEKDGPHDIRIRDFHRTFPYAVRQGVEPGSRDLRFQLQDTDPFQVEVVGERGQAIEEYLVVTYDEGDGALNAAQRREGTHEDGLVSLQAPVDPFMIHVFAEGHFKVEVGPFMAHTVPAVVRIELEELAHVMGRVVSGGEPVAGAYVFLGERVPVRKKLMCRGFPLLFNGFSNTSSRGRTDAEGRFDIAVDTDGEYFFSVSKDGYAGSRFEPFQLGPRRGREDIELELARGGRLEGKVVLPPGKSPRGLSVRISRGDFDVRAAAVDDEGIYQFEHLAPGPWMVQLGSQPPGQGNGPSAINESDLPEGVSAFDWAFDIRDGRTTRYDLDARRLEIQEPEATPTLVPR